jgi:sugar phosphate permease
MKYETRLIWVLTITFGFVFLDRNAASFLMPFIADDLHFNNSQVGLVASALSFTWALAAFLGSAHRQLPAALPITTVCRRPSSSWRSVRSSALC